jgi:hypothetical protein
LGATPPLGFGAFNTLDFSGWGGNYNTRTWGRFLEEVARIARAPLLQPTRRRLVVLPQALVLTGAWGLLLGLAMWGLYPRDGPEVTTSVLGHPVIDSIALGVVAAAPVALWSALETERAGFEKLGLIARRSLIWFAYGGGIALVVVALGAAAGVLDAASPRGLARQLGSAFVSLSAASAFALTVGRLGWFWARHALGLRADTNGP